MKRKRPALDGGLGGVGGVVDQARVGGGTARAVALFDPGIAEPEHQLGRRRRRRLLGGLGIVGLSQTEGGQERGERRVETPGVEIDGDRLLVEPELEDLPPKAGKQDRDHLLAGVQGVADLLPHPVGVDRVEAQNGDVAGGVDGVADGGVEPVAAREPPRVGPHGSTAGLEGPAKAGDDGVVRRGVRDEDLARHGIPPEFQTRVPPPGPPEPEGPHDRGALEGLGQGRTAGIMTS